MVHGNIYPPHTLLRTLRSAWSSEAQGGSFLLCCLPCPWCFDSGTIYLNAVMQLGGCNIFGSEHITAGQQTASPIKELLEHSLRLRTLLPCKRKQDGSRCPGRLQCSSTRTPCCWQMMAHMLMSHSLYVSSSTMTICAMGFWTLSCNFHT